jgi:hypothetical protein
MKKILITEEEKYRIRNLYEQDIISYIVNYMKKFFVDDLKFYKEVIPNISKEYYNKDDIKEDAFRHILASAYFTTRIGGTLTRFAGEVNEILGALKKLLEGYGFDSGWVMDSKNNEIGISLGLKNRNSDIKTLSKLVKNIIDSGNFYTNNGILYKNDKNPKK